MKKTKHVKKSLEKQKYSIQNSEERLVHSLKNLEKQVKDHGFIQEDRHLNRKTYSLPGHFMVVGRDELEYLKKYTPLGKYSEDWKRMSFSFNCAVNAAKADQDSRQLLVLNTENYNNVYQCFNLFQFVNTHRNEFDMYVYQRSADMSKMLDDLGFFGYVISEFERLSKKKVTKLIVVYGHIHIAYP